MSTPPLPPGRRWNYLALATSITFVLVALLVAFNRQYLFHTPLYEHGDPGTNSLSVLRAARFHEIYGAFSRWELHHPGPALFYLLAGSEWLFYRTLHLTPTPYGAQVLGTIILGLGFFAAALTVAARWIGGRFFLPLVLLLATSHYTAADPHLSLLSTWPPYTMPMIFLALVVAAASVGAGQGDDLPLLVLAGSFAVHSHLAQPLFVVPLAVLGYVGLAVSCYRTAGLPPAHGNTRAGEQMVARLPWRRFPRAHIFAGMLLFAFVLPMLADLCKGKQSNLYRIFAHLPSDPSKHHPWLACVYYVVRFATYHPSRPGAEYFFSGHATGQEIVQYCVRHPQMFLLWIGALLSPLAALAFRRRQGRRGSKTAAGDADAGTFSEHASAATGEWPADAAASGRWRFVKCLLGCWALCLVLTVYWAHLQEVEMAYYNVWFVYSVWFLPAVAAAAALGDALETCVVRFGRPGVWQAATVAVCLLGAVLTLRSHAESFRARDYTDAASIAQAITIQNAAAAQTGGRHTKILAFPTLGGGPAAGAMVLLARLGYDSRAQPELGNAFGTDHAPPGILDGMSWGTDRSPSFDVWRIVPAASNPAAAAQRPLVGGYALVLDHPEVDPGANAEITFAGEHPNYDDFAVVGWTTRLTNVPFTTSEGREALLCFRPRPVADGKSVEVVFDTFPMLFKGVCDVQRVDVGINGDQLGTWHLDTGVVNPLPRVVVPGAVWNKLPVAVLTLHFLDTYCPAEIHPGDDPRRFALGTRKIIFRTVETPPALP